MAEEDARSPAGADADGRGQAADVGRRLDLLGRDGKGWTVAGIDPKSGDIILTKPAGNGITTTSISQEQYEQLKQLGPNSKYRKPTLRYRLGNTFQSGIASVSVAAYDDVTKRALVEVNEGAGVTRQWVPSAQLEQLVTKHATVEDLLRPAEVAEKPKPRTALKPEASSAPAAAAAKTTKELKRKKDLSNLPVPMATPAEGKPASDVTEEAEEESASAQEEQKIEEAMAEAMQEVEQASAPSASVKQTREQLRAKRMQAKATALKDDPEAELFVRLITAGVPFQESRFDQTLTEFQTARPFGEEQKPADALALAAIAYLQEEGAQAKDAAWRPFVRKAVETVADSPARDPLYQAIVLNPSLLMPGAPDALHLPATRAERVQTFALRFPAKARSYAYADQEIAIAVQAVEQRQAAAPVGTLEVGIEARSGGGVNRGAAVAALGAAAAAVGALSLEQRQAQLIQSAKAIQAGFQAIAQQHTQRLDGIRQELGEVTRQISQIESGHAAGGTAQVQANVPALEQRRQELQDEQLNITLQVQENKSAADRFSRSLTSFEKAEPAAVQQNEFENTLNKVPGPVRKAGVIRSPSSSPTVYGRASTPSTAAKNAARAATRIGARRSIGRSALAGAYLAAASLIGGQQAARRASEVEQDAYSTAFRPESGEGGRRSVIELPARSYTVAEEGEGEDSLPSGSEESRKVRSKEQKMRETVEFQLGEEAFEPSEEEREEGAEIEFELPEGAEKGLDEGAEEAISAEAPGEAVELPQQPSGPSAKPPQTELEAERAQDLLAGQQQARTAQGATGAAAGATAAQGGGLPELPGNLGGAQRILRLYNMMKYGSSATGIGIFVTIALMNLALFARVLHWMGFTLIPKQTAIEDIATIALDICIGGTIILMMVPLMLGIAALAGAVATGYFTTGAIFDLLRSAF